MIRVLAVVFSASALLFVQEPDKPIPPAKITIHYKDRILHKGLSEDAGTEIYYNFPSVTHWWLAEVKNVRETPDPISVVIFNVL